MTMTGASGVSAGRASDEFVAKVRASGSPACVGLDPVLEKLPPAIARGSEAEAIETFSRGVIDAVAGVVPAVKFQSACFERYGWQGVRALESSMKRAREAGLVVILDAKRGDIGISAAHYAAAAQHAGAHFVTVSGYLGVSGIEPFLAAGLGVFVLVRTSNPDSARVQSQKLAQGGTVAEAMAGVVRELGSGHAGAEGLSDVGAVVGATQAREGAALRELMPQQIFLIPGFGAQGGSVKDICTMVRPGEAMERAGVLATASRSVLYPESAAGGAEWQGTIRDAARRFADEIRAALKN